MKVLNDDIKVIGVEAIAGCLLLLANADNKNRECITVSFDWNNGPVYPMSKLMLIDQATTFNAFNGLKTEEEGQHIKKLLTQRLSNEHIEEVNTLLTKKEFIEYISFNGSYLTRYPADRFQRNQINAQYMVERYKLADHRYLYKMLCGHQEEQYISVGNWRITNIRSADQPGSALYFDLIDSKGKSSEDKSLPYHWVIEGAVSRLFSVALPNDDTGLSDMMDLALEAARFDNWLDFIKYKFAAIVLQKSTLKIERLTQEANSFKSKLSDIIKLF